MSPCTKILCFLAKTRVFVPSTIAERNRLGSESRFFLADFPRGTGSSPRVESLYFLSIDSKPRPGCIHSVVNGTQSSAYLRIENCTKPSFVAFRSRRDMRPEYLDKQNLGQPTRDDFRSRRLFFHL